MTAHTLKDETREKLMGVSVATLATALFKRGLRNQTIQDVRPLSNKGRNMVGPAFTLRYIPAREDRNQLAEFRNPEHPQRKAIETCPPGSVLVMDSRKDARAASAGDSNPRHRYMGEAAHGVAGRDAQSAGVPRLPGGGLHQRQRCGVPRHPRPPEARDR